MDETAATLGEDATRYARLMRPLARNADALLEELLGPLRVPRHPLALARFGLGAGLPAASLARIAFRGERARGFFAGLAAHSMLPLSQPATAGYGLVLGLLGHAAGWPLARGGSQQLADALASLLRSLGGEIETGREVTSLAELDGAGAVMLDVGPHQLVRLAGERLPSLYRRRVEGFRYGPGVFKLDWALDGPIPWRVVRLRPGRDRPSRRHARRDRRLRASPVAEPDLRRAVRAARAAEPVRPVARAGRKADRVGVLPRPERLDAWT